MQMTKFCLCHKDHQCTTKLSTGFPQSIIDLQQLTLLSKPLSSSPAIAFCRHQHMALQMLGRAQGEQPDTGIPTNTMWGMRELPCWKAPTAERPLLPSKASDEGVPSSSEQDTQIPSVCVHTQPSLPGQTPPSLCPTAPSLSAPPGPTYREASSKQDGAVGGGRGWHPTPAARAAVSQGLLLLSIRAPAYQGSLRDSRALPPTRQGGAARCWGGGRVALLRGFCSLNNSGAPHCPFSSKSISDNHLHDKLRSQLCSAALMFKNLEHWEKTL